MHINNNFNVDTLLFEDSQIIIAKTEDELQCTLSNLQTTGSKFDISLSVNKKRSQPF
jgi:hypothetical protein